MVGQPNLKTQPATRNFATLLKITIPPCEGGGHEVPRGMFHWMCHTRIATFITGCLLCPEEHPPSPLRKGERKSDIINHKSNIKKMTRGIRNNNPLNIRRTATRWQGACKEQKDKSFVQFKTMAYGYRAAWKVLQTYYEASACKASRSPCVTSSPVGHLHRRTIPKPTSGTF